MTISAFEADIRAYNRLTPNEKKIAERECEKAYKYKDIVYSVCRQKHASLADDILQHIAAKACALKFVHAACDDAYYRNLIRRTAKNLLRDVVRRKDNSSMVFVENYDDYDKEGEFSPYARRADNPAIRVTHQSALQDIENALDAMEKESEAHARYVQIFRLCVFDQKAPLEVADRIGVARDYVDVAMKRVRDRLTRILE